MSSRSILYWFICTVLAALVAHSAEPAAVESISSWAGPPTMDAARLAPVPEPGRALLLFAGIMAMAFTYRRAWMNWKSGSKP